MSDIWAAHPSRPIRQTSTHQKTYFLPFTGLMHFTQDIKVQMNLLCSIAFKLTTTGCHMVTGMKRVKNTKHLSERIHLQLHALSLRGLNPCWHLGSISNIPHLQSESCMLEDTFIQCPCVLLIKIHHEYRVRSFSPTIL